MVVGRGQGIAVWYWSPCAMRFGRLERPGDLIVTPFGVYQPGVGFAEGLSVP